MIAISSRGILRTSHLLFVMTVLYGLPGPLVAQFDGVFQGHEGAIVMSLFAPDGQSLLTASSDQSARLWDVATGKMIRHYNQHTGPLYSLAISGDGRTLVTGSQDNTVRAWDVPLSKPVRGFADQALPVATLVLSPDGRQLLSAAADKLIRIHDITEVRPGAMPQPTIVRAGHTAEVTAISTRSDFVQYVTADSTGRMLIWSPEVDVPLGRLLGHPGKITSVAVPSTNQQVFSTGDDGLLRIWQLGPAPPREMAVHAVVPLDLTPVPGQNVFVWSGADGSLKLVDVTTSQVVRELPKGEGPLAGHVVAPNAAWYVVWGADGRAQTLNFADGTPRGSVAGHTGAITDVAIHADATRYATSGIDGTVRLWQQPIAPVDAKGHTGPVRGLLSYTNGQRLASISDDLSTRFWSSAGVPQAQLAGHEQPLRAMALRDDEALLATGDAAGIVWVWNAGSGAVEGYVAAHAGGITALTFSADRTMMVTSGADGLVRSWLLPLPKQKPAEGEAPPKPVWEFAVPGGPALQLGRLTQEQGLAILPTSGDRIARLKWDGTSPGAIPSPGRPLKTLETSFDGSQLVAVDDQGSAHHWKVDGTLVKSMSFGEGVTAAHFQRDAPLLCLCDGKPRVRIASLETGTVIEEIPAPFPVTDACWTAADHRSLVLRGPGNDMVIVTRTLQRIWEGVPGGVASLAMTPDQQFILAAGGDGKVRQWNITDGSLTRILEGPPAPLVKMTLSTNGQLVSAIDGKDQLHLWSTGDGLLKKSITLPCPAKAVTSTPDGTRVATAGADGVVRVWDAGLGHLLESFAEHTGPVVAVRYLPDGITLLSTGDDKRLVSSRTAIVRAFPIHKGPVRGMALYGGGSQVITIGDDRRVVMTEVSGGTVTRELGIGEAEPTMVAVRPDQQRIAVGTKAGEVLVWNVNAPDQPMTRLNVGAEVAAVAWSLDNLKLAVASVAKTLHLFGPTPQNIQPPVELVQHQQFTTEGSVRTLLCSAESRSVWSASDNGKIEEWMHAAPGATRQFGHGGPVYGVAVSKDGRTIISSSTDQTVRIWDTVTQQQRFQLNGHVGAVHAVTLSPDETFAISSGADGTLRLWDVTGGRQLKQLAKFEATMYSLAIHPNGQLLAAAGADRKVHLLDVATGSEQRVLEGHPDYIHCVAFNPAGDRLLSYGYAGYLKAWNVADGKLLSEQRVGRVGNFAAYSPDGTRVVLSNGDGTARILAAP